METRINHHQEKCNRINWLLFSGPTGVSISFPHWFEWHFARDKLNRKLKKADLRLWGT